MKLVNLTPHEVVFFRQSDCVKTPRGFVLTANADPVLRVPSTGLARADAAERELGYVECNGVVLPCVRNDYETSSACLRSLSLTRCTSSLR